MQINVQDFLPLVEETGKIAFIDIEATGLRGDYNSILTVSVKPYGKKAYSFVVDRPGNDKSILAAVREDLESYLVWVTFYGKMFDIPMIQTRLINHSMTPLEGRHHLDLHFVAKSHLLTARKSQAHLLAMLGTPQQKMQVSPEMWNQVLANPERALKTLVSRCESDVEGLEALYNRIKHVVKDLKIDD